MQMRLCLALAALACASCGSNGLYQVGGKVTYKGKPAVGAVVHFYRVGGDPMKEQSIMGIVEKDGSFNLACGHLGKGAPAGEYAVLIEWRERPPQAQGLAKKSPDRLHGRYADLKRPLFHAVVKPEGNSLLEFEVTD